MWLKGQNKILIVRIDNLKKIILPFINQPKIKKLYFGEA